MAADRSALLGLSPDADPDAADGVAQWSLGDLDPLRDRARYLALGLPPQAPPGAQPRRPGGKGGAHEEPGVGAALAATAVNAAAFVAFVAVLWPQLPGAFRGLFDLKRIAPSLAADW